MNRTKLLQAMLVASSMIFAAGGSAATKNPPAQTTTSAAQSSDMKQADRNQTSTMSTESNDDMAKPSKPAKARSSSGGGKMTIASLTKFEDLDKNKDGEIAKDEVPANLDLVNSFASYDKNSDGKLSKDEFAAYQHGGRNLASAKPAKKPAKK